MTRKLIIYSILMLIIPSGLLAQSEASATASVYKIAFDSALSRLNQRQLAIYNGREYYQYFIKQNGHQLYGRLAITTSASRPGEHPFFTSEGFRSEKIEYEGVVYQPINLAYDICRSEVVVLNPQEKVIVLAEGKVKSFTYAGHTFRSLNTIDQLKPDFYDILYWSDSTSLVVKRKKNQTELWHTISDYYIILNNKAYPVGVYSGKTVGVKAALLDILSDQKTAVRTYIRESKLKFSKKKKEQSLIKLVEYYASLKPR